MPQLSTDFFSSLSLEELDHLEKLATSSDPEDARALTSLVAELSSMTDGSRIAIGPDGLVVPLDTSKIFQPSPSAKQLVLLSKRTSDDGIDEVLYGGSLFGGKTVGLLHAAMQYVHVPGYHAIFFRRTRNNLQDVIDRLRLQIEPEHARFVGNQRGGRFIFPSGALLDMGYMQYDANKMNYKGPEYQCILYDELTEFEEAQYTYLFSRLRSAECPFHNKGFLATCADCQRAGILNKVPLRCLTASNPDGDGRKWVRARFVSGAAMQDIEDGCPKDSYPINGRVFIPSSVRDNPGADADKFIKQQQARLNTREQAMLLKGSWKEMEGALFSDRSFQRFTKTHDRELTALRDGMPICRIQSPGAGYRFTTVDVAHTSSDKAKESKGHAHSWSVAATWEYHLEHGKMLFLIDIWRDRVESFQLLYELRELYARLRPHAVIVEEVVGSKFMIETLTRENIPIKSFNPNQQRFRGRAGGSPGKLERSHAFQMMCKNGEVFIPEQQHDWVAEYLLEMTCWTGLESEQADQVDVSSMAAIEIEDEGATMDCGEFDSPASVAFDGTARTVAGLWSFT